MYLWLLISYITDCTCHLIFCCVCHLVSLKFVYNNLFVPLLHFVVGVGTGSRVSDIIDLTKTVVTCKIKRLQNSCKNVLVIYFTCNHL